MSAIFTGSADATLAMLTDAAATSAARNILGIPFSPFDCNCVSCGKLDVCSFATANRASSPLASEFCRLRLESHRFVDSCPIKRDGQRGAGERQTLGSCPSTSYADLGTPLPPTTVRSDLRCGKRV